MNSLTTIRRGIPLLVLLAIAGCATPSTSPSTSPSTRQDAAVDAAHDRVMVELQTRSEEAPPAESLVPGGVHLFELESPCLTEFWGRSISMQAGVVLPPTYERGRDYPICYSIHGFGGSHRAAWRAGSQLIARMADKAYPEMIYVFLNAKCPMGHHEFADSVNNGPWGRALTTELLPALEHRYVPGATARNRFLTGHSSGGWSSLWLQCTYPDAFNGTWSTAPDSVDFRDFTGIDIYSFTNGFTDPSGETIQLMRKGTEWIRSIQTFVEQEREHQPIGGQFYSFNAVFSPRSDDGTPQMLLDWETGKIDPVVAESWKKYDIAHQLRTRWSDLGPRLKEKIHVYMGSLDTFRLEGATRLLKRDLAELGSDADIIIVEGRNHGSLFGPHDDYWPEGMMSRVYREMRARFDEPAAQTTLP